MIDQNYAAFEGIDDNWQQLRSYRDTIALGVSRGRLSGILTDMVRQLHDGHVFMTENAVAFTPLQRDLPLVVPVGNELPSWNWGQTDHFGAALTPLPDSTLLVYAAVLNHPLGLVPGDIILGYDGRLWKDLYKDLFKVQFPMSFYLIMQCSKSAAMHQWLGAAGMNWHLFDTIDVVKYSTGDTVHLPTSLITGPMPGIHATEQLPVKGVPFPDVSKGERVSWGYVEGTRIGYIYVLGWDENVPVHVNPIAPAFLAAVDTILADRSSEGIIIDLRTNEGADAARWTSGFSTLFSQNLNAMGFLVRATATEHRSLRVSTQWNAFGSLSGSGGHLYDRPIAVLSGPWSFSGGDMSVHLLGKHPMARTFGLPSAGAFGMTDLSDPPVGWFRGRTVAVGYTPPDTSAKLYRKSIPVDEEVWLTRDGVAKGEDDVVKRAVEWINTLTYAHDVALNRGYVPPGQDSVLVTAVLTNPLGHSASVSSIVTDLAGVVRDSVPLYNDGLHGDGSAGDSVWGRYVQVPPDENFFDIALRTDDATQGTFRRLPSVAAFATCGPLALDSVAFKNQPAYQYCSARTYVRSDGLTAAVKGASITCECNDPWMKRINVGTFSLPEISPGTKACPSSPFIVNYDSSTFPGYFNLKFKLAINGYTFWTDSMKLAVTGVAPRPQLPTVYSLMQNYPNPFNPTTEIRYQISEVSNVSLKVYDVLGREVRTLVNRKQGPGTYEVQFDASGLASGVYFYKLQAGPYTEIKKCLLMK